MHKKKAFITGITGQDGSYLAEFLLRKKYEVHGLIRRSSLENFDRIKDIRFCYKDAFYLHYGDLVDFGSVINLIRKIRPDEIYHMDAMSDVRISFDIPEYTANVTGVGTLRVLEAIRQSNLDLKNIKFYQASSSEVFGKALEIPQKETTPFYPRSPYAVSKVFAHWMCKNYRESYNMFICSGILFNHESPRRGENFVTRKITRGIANILAGGQEKINLGNLNAKRDWGYAPEFIEAIWLMMQQEQPDDYVIATGESHSVREFLEEAFSYTNLRWQDHIKIDKNLFRPAETDLLIGDASKAKEMLGWEPKTKFKNLVRILLQEDCKAVGVKISKFKKKFIKN